MPQSTAKATRRFGFIFTVFLVIVAFSPLVLHRGGLRIWALVLAVICASLSIVVPKALAPLESAWQKLGLALHHVTNPIFMALIYWLAFVPSAIGLRLLGKELLPLRRDSATPTYWIVRSNPGISAESMSRQF